MNAKKFLKRITLSRVLIFFYILQICLSVLITYTNLGYFAIDAKETLVEDGKVLSAFDSYKLDKRVDDIYNTLSSEEKIGQSFMVSINGTSVDENTKNLIEKYGIGGIVLMNGNITSIPQVQQLIDESNKLSKADILFATDQEGGTVERVPWDGARYITQRHIGVVNTETFAYGTGAEHARVLRDVGIGINLAPVLDTYLAQNSDLLNRTLSDDPQKVAKLGSAIIQAHHDQGVASCAKHFPGIGRSSVDSHNDLPVIDVSKKQLLAEELLPFKAAIEKHVDAIMVGHAMYPKIDDKYPSSLSKIIITDILKNELGYEGIIITDDIGAMKALDGYKDKAVQAINAGTDMIIIVESYENQVKYIEQVREAVESGAISEERFAESVKRVLRFKYKNG